MDVLCENCGEAYESRNEGGEPPYLCDPCAQLEVVDLRTKLERAERSEEQTRASELGLITDMSVDTAVLINERDAARHAAVEAVKERDEVTARTLHLAHGMKKQGGVYGKVAELLESFCAFPVAGQPVIRIVEQHRDQLQEEVVDLKKRTESAERRAACAEATLELIQEFTDTTLVAP